MVGHLMSITCTSSSDVYYTNQVFVPYLVKLIIKYCKSLSIVLEEQKKNLL